MVTIRYKQTDALAASQLLNSEAQSIAASSFAYTLSYLWTNTNSSI
jgi:hypothetical protein